MVHIQPAIISGETEPHRLITQICPLALISQQLLHAHFMFPTLRIPHVLVMVYLHLYERFSEKHTLSDRIYRYRSGHWKSQPRQLNAKERRFTKALEKSTAPVDFSNAKERRLPLLGMSMSQEHHRSKGRDQRKQGVVFL